MNHCTTPKLADCWLGITLLLPLLLSIGCKRGSEPQAQKEYRFEQALQIDGLSRTYTLVLPDGYYEGENFPLLLALHGGGGSAGQFETSSRLSETARAAPFVVVYPEGVASTGPLGARTWNAGGCCAYARDQNIDDVGFIVALIEHLLKHYRLDPKRVFVTGMSNGGMMAYRLACEIPHKIAAIAPVACSMVVTQPCTPERPVPVLHLHSAQDTRVPAHGGRGVTQAYFPPLDSVLQVWVQNNQCPANSKTVEQFNLYQLNQWKGCSENASIHYYLTQDGGHSWPGGLAGGPNGDEPSGAIKANDLIWDFFQLHQLP